MGPLTGSSSLIEGSQQDLKYISNQPQFRDTSGSVDSDVIIFPHKVKLNTNFPNNIPVLGAQLVTSIIH